jgi:hypothetical protein
MPYPIRRATEANIIRHLEALARVQSERSLDGRLHEDLRVHHGENERILLAAAECVRRAFGEKLPPRCDLDDVKEET